MTREEVIKWFKESPFMHKDHVPFQMAIEALENENALLDRVLEIMDKKWAEYCEDKDDNQIDTEVLICHAWLRNEVLKMKGEQE